MGVNLGNKRQKALLCIKNAPGSENPRVGGSNPPLGTITMFGSLFINHLLPNFDSPSRTTIAGGSISFWVWPATSRCIALEASSFLRAGFV